MQVVRDGRASIASLKEQIQAQNRSTHVEQVQATRELSCSNECSKRLQQQELENLQQSLANLHKMVTLEEQAHTATAEQLKLLTDELNNKAASWADNAQQDVADKEAKLEVCTYLVCSTGPFVA